MTRFRRQARLAAILHDLGFPTTAVRAPAPRLDTMPVDAAERTLDLYRRLGGRGEAALVLRPGSWDLVLDDGRHVELDEEQHFNRYRAVTFAPAWTEQLPWTADYRRYADAHETACLRKAKRGGYWTSPSTEWMFGPADPPGEFALHGSPRWKQRALYDGMRDALASVGGVRLTRLSIYDRLGDTSLGAVLDDRAPLDPELFLALVESREVSVANGSVSSTPAG